MFNMDLIDDYLTTYTKSKNITLKYDFSKNIVIALFKCEEIGSVTYIISSDDITIYNLRNRDVEKQEEKTIHILDVDVNSNHREMKLGTLLIASTILIGYKMGCTYSILDDMSDRAAQRVKNIYAKFGYTHKYVTNQPTNAIILGFPEKQLELTSPLLLLQTIKKLLIL